jgi:peptidoglycan/xylan/chitin deacetylase (PgdA/CDA1 family)
VDPRVLAELERHGYRDVRWHVALDDWEPWRTGEAIASDTIDGVRSHGDGSIVLLHTWPGGTGEGLATLIDGLAELGASFVTVEGLDELP